MRAAAVVSSSRRAASQQRTARQPAAASRALSPNKQSGAGHQAAGARTAGAGAAHQGDEDLTDAEDQDPEADAEGCAGVVEVIDSVQRLAAGDGIHYAQPHHHDELAGQHEPETELGTCGQQGAHHITWLAGQRC